MAVDKLPQVLNEKWWFYVDDKDEDWPDLIMFENGYHERHSCMKGFQLSRESARTKSEETRTETNGFQRHRTSVRVQM